MSKVNVNTIEPETGTTLTLGAASDVIQIPASGEIDIASGATLDVNGTIDLTGATTTGFPVGGITEADMWRITADQTNPAGDITANWEQVDTDGFAVLGSGLSESSGIFTFPSTGYWSVSLYSVWNNPSADERYLGIYLYTTLNNSSYSGASYSLGSLAGGTSTRNGSASCNFIFDVTSTANCKFKVQGLCSLSSTVLQGDSDRCETYVSVIRLGDT